MRNRIKEICDYISRGAAPDYVDESPNKVMNQATFSKGYIDESNVRFSSKNPGYAQIHKGDLLMASTGGGVLGKVVYFDKNENDFYADSHVSILRNSKGKNSMKFLYYWFSTRYDEINATMVKGSTNQTELQRDYLLNYEIDIPGLEVQQRVVSYLDEKTGKIDRVVALLEKKREAYVRLKTSLINRVVTRGLDPSVAMRPSGIDWLGDIPAHWSVRRIKDLGDLGSGTTPKSSNNDYYEDGIHPWLNTGCVQNCIIEEPAKHVTDLALKECKGLKFFPKDTILVAMYGGGTIGNVGLMGFPSTINQACCAVTINYNNLPKYIFYALMAQNKKLVSLGFGGTQVNLSQGQIANFIISIPPLEEQRAIAAYLDEKCGAIDAAIEITGKQIDAYKRLKRSLINEVVTGQRAV